MKAVCINEKYIPILKKTFLFKNAEDSVICKVLCENKDSFFEYSKNDVIYSRQKYKKSLGLILEGSVTVKKTLSGGGEIIMNTLNPGSSFGGAAVFRSSKGFIGELVAGKDCRILFLSEKALHKLFKQDIRFAEVYITFLADSLAFLNKKIDGLTQKDAEGKLAAYLLDAYKESDFNTSLCMQYSMTRLAELLAIGRASLYRAFDAFEKDGTLFRDKKQITINNVEALMKKCEEKE